jgi:hypothetical protein
MKLDFSQKFFEKYSNIKFYENPPSEAELFHASEMQTEGRKDMEKLMVFFADVPKMASDEERA